MTKHQREIPDTVWNIRSTSKMPDGVGRIFQYALNVIERATINIAHRFFHVLVSLCALALVVIDLKISKFSHADAGRMSIPEFHFSVGGPIVI